MLEMAKGLFSFCYFLRSYEGGIKMNEQELQVEKNYLNATLKIIDEKLANLGGELLTDQEKALDFKKFIWDNKSSMDAKELKSLMSDNDLEIYLMTTKGKYFQKLFRIQNSPYFASIIFNDGGKDETIYIGITHLEKNDKHYIHDWRSPICSLFYDYEVGKASYIAPEGVIAGDLKRKRQYKIEERKLKAVFDNSINIDDELLQEVLAQESSEKMRNIVNTIQQEQNKIIRNVTDRSLIVQGIAGSGKTSVALHRIAFLLYKLENLTSNSVLIFSPNQIFTEYISDVLPSLGEDNTMQTTIHDFLMQEINEYQEVESFLAFTSRYYQKEVTNKDLIKYKQSDAIIQDLLDYVNDFNTKYHFSNDITDNLYYFYSKEELEQMFYDRYFKFPFFERVEEMARTMSYQSFDGKYSHVGTFRKLLLESLGVKKDFKNIYYNFYKSPYCKVTLIDQEIKNFVSKKKLAYEDATLFVYLKGLLSSFPYHGEIKQVVIDEAQDYSKLQYLVLNKIFPKAGFTILGDVNQTINPYYKYDSLETLTEIFKSSSYLELNKTYRSTKEIIDYTNNILGLNHVSAIRREEAKEVVVKHDLATLKSDVKRLKEEYKSLAIIVSCEDDAIFLEDYLKSFEPSRILETTKVFRKDFIIVPAYVAKGLEFDAVIVYNLPKEEKYLYYVACTRAQHELVIYDTLNE